jgi:hypothetical protein
MREPRLWIRSKMQASMKKKPGNRLDQDARQEVERPRVHGDDGVNRVRVRCEQARQA